MSGWSDHAFLTTLSAWLAAYWVHAGILHACALVIARWGRMPLRSRDRLWRLALLLPIATATAAHLMPGASFRGLRERAGFVSAAPARMQVTVQSQVTASGAIASDIAVARSGERLMRIVLVYFLGAGVLATVLHVVRLRRCARVRRRSRDGDAVLADHPLGIDSRRRARVRLADMPREMGIGFAAGACDIVLSGDAVAALSVEHRHAVLSHEMAHLRRRDPLWLGLAAWVSALFAFQPSNRLMVSRMRRDAEFACDRIALGQVGSLELYLDCLVALATRFDPCEAPGFASSLVLQRAERLIEADTEPNRVPAWPSVTILAAGALLAWAAPAGSRSAAVAVSAVAAANVGNEARTSGAGASVHGTTVVVRVQASRVAGEASPLVHAGQHP